MDEEKSFYEKALDLFAMQQSRNARHFSSLRKSRTFMSQRYSEDIDLARISEVARMSRYHYIRVFQRVYGIAPRQYLRDLRILKAKELLKKGISVTEACLEVGYTSLPTFSRAFKKCTGHSPKDIPIVCGPSSGSDETRG
jgi:AraC-like DNA-binding protein